MIVVATETERDVFRSEKEEIIVTGVGYANVYRALSAIPRDTPITNIGYAGSNSLKIGTGCFIGECRHYHPNVEYKEPVYKLNGTHTCYTSDDFVTQTEIKEPVVFDMELYAILSMGFTNVVAIKIISDNLSLKQYNELQNKINGSENND